MTHDRTRLLAALDTLPHRPRTVYLLSAVDDLSCADIAFRLGEPVPVIEAALVEALALLDARLNETPG